IGRILTPPPKTRKNPSPRPSPLRKGRGRRSQYPDAPYRSADFQSAVPPISSRRRHRNVRPPFSCGFARVHLDITTVIGRCAGFATLSFLLLVCSSHACLAASTN